MNERTKKIQAILAEHGDGCEFYFNDTGHFLRHIGDKHYWYDDDIAEHLITDDSISLHKLYDVASYTNVCIFDDTQEDYIKACLWMSALDGIDHVKLYKNCIVVGDLEHTSDMYHIYFDVRKFQCDTIWKYEIDSAIIEFPIDAIIDCYIIMECLCFDKPACGSAKGYMKKIKFNVDMPTWDKIQLIWEAFMRTKMPIIPIEDQRLSDITLTTSTEFLQN